MINSGTIFMLTMISLSLSVPSLTLRDNFMLLNTCVCPHTGYNLTFQCTTIGRGNTLWKGSAFDCNEHGDEISLQHSLFSHQGSVIRICGNFTGHILSVQNNFYISQVSVPFSFDLIGHSIECIHDNANLSLHTIVGNSTISITTEPFPPPGNLTLAHIQPGLISELTFKWTKVAPDCTDIQYHISSDCGQCPMTTNSTMVVCQGVQIPSSGHNNYSFVIKTVACGDSDLTGSNFEHLHVRLQVPDAPKVAVYPVYSAGTGRLISLKTEWMELTTFNVTKELSGSATSFNVIFTDATTGKMCDSYTITCVTDLIEPDMQTECGHILNVSTSLCQYLSSMNVLVSATNLFETGPLSNPILIFGTSYDFVDVMVDVESSAVSCIFHGQREYNSVKTCSITYNTSKTCGPWLNTLHATCGKQYAESVSNVVTVGLPLLQHNVVYYYVVTANNGTYTALVQGTFNKGSASQSGISFRVPFIILVPTMSLLMLLMVFGFIISTIILIRKQRKTKIEFIQSQVMEIPSTNEDDLASLQCKY